MKAKVLRQSAQVLQALLATGSGPVQLELDGDARAAVSKLLEMVERLCEAAAHDSPIVTGEQRLYLDAFNDVGASSRKAERRGGKGRDSQITPAEPR